MNDNRHVAHTDNSEIEGTSLHEASLEEDEELVEPNTVEQTQTAVEQPSDQKRPRDDDDAIVEAGDEALAKRQANSNVRAVPRVKNEPWDVMFERLRIYKQIHGVRLFSSLDLAISCHFLMRNSRLTVLVLSGRIVSFPRGMLLIPSCK